MHVAGDNGENRRGITVSQYIEMLLELDPAALVVVPVGSGFMLSASKPQQRGAGKKNADTGKHPYQICAIEPNVFATCVSCGGDVVHRPGKKEGK